MRQVHLDSAGFHEWVGTLRSASALEAYRRTYRASMDPADVVAFLLLSRSFPRSVLYALTAAEECLRDLQGREAPSRPLRLAGRLRADLEFADVPELMAEDLDAELLRIDGAIRQVCSSVGVQYFTNSREFDLQALQVFPGERSPA